jgi:hypothetical protein
MVECIEMLKSDPSLELLTFPQSIPTEQPNPPAAPTEERGRVQRATSTEKAGGGAERGKDDNYLRNLARRPSLALEDWPKLSTEERDTVVTHMTRLYSADFARQFLETAQRKDRPEVLTNPTNHASVTPEKLTEQGYRYCGKKHRSDQIWVHPTGREVWVVAPGQTEPDSQASSGPEQGSTTYPPESQPPLPEGRIPLGVEEIPLSGDPEKYFGKRTVDMKTMVIGGQVGLVNRYEDGTIEFYVEGKPFPKIYRPRPEGGPKIYEVYGEDGKRLYQSIAVDLEEQLMISLPPEHTGQ